MIGKKTLEKKPIPAAEVKDILEEFSKKHELNYEQNLTLAHVSSLNKLSLEDTKKLIDELIEFLSDKEDEKQAILQAVNIANLLPKDLDDLRLIFAKERISLSTDDMKEILEILDKYEIDETEELFL